MEEKYFAERGIAYRANEWRQGRPTLLFLHGLSGSSSAWLPYETHFREAFNLIVPDLRGHGKSKRWNAQGSYAFSEYAGDIAALLAALQATRVTIVAHSFAAVVVRELLKRHQTPVERAALLAPAYGVQRLTRTKLVTPALAAWCWLIGFASVKRLGERVDYRRFVGCRDWDFDRIRTDIRTTGIHSYFWSLLELHRYPDAPWREFTNIETRIVHGPEDRFVPFSHAAELARTLPRAQLIPLKSANHMLILNNAEEIARLIRSFVVKERNG